MIAIPLGYKGSRFDRERRVPKSRIQETEFSIQNGKGAGDLTKQLCVLLSCCRLLVGKERESEKARENYNNESKKARRRNGVLE